MANQDVNDWESTRDKIYERYQLNAASNGFNYAGWTESSTNFAVTILALLYGEMDYRRTVQIGTLSGWDSWLLPQPVMASLDENPLYNLQQRSANHNVAEAGGTVTASSSVSGSEIESIADGFEHDFSGSEWFGNIYEFVSDLTESAILTVIYGRDVTIHTIRLIEGYDQGGYSNINVEIYISDQWVKQPYAISQGILIDSEQPLQIIDLIF